MNYDIHPERGYINKGNVFRIKRAMKMALSGEDICVAFLGGSITQGSLSSTPDKCYAALVHKWWKERFPESNVRFINAGIGGTTSQFGVSRVYDHVLVHQPDFILAEFAVNDENNKFFRETYEGLVRVILSDAKRPALMLMNNVRYDNGENAEDQHLAVARHYDVPMVSMKETIFEEVKKGNIEYLTISPDGLHPNDEGHMLVARVITEALQTIYDLSDDIYPATYDRDDGIYLPSPVTANGYERSLRIKSVNMNMNGIKTVMNGFTVDAHEKKEFLDIFSGGFIAEKAGDYIEFEAECTGIAIQYRKSVNKPTPIATAVIDDDKEHPVILDGNFDEDWGDCLFIETAAKELSYGKHRIRITISTTHPDDKVPFYLVSLMINR